MFQIKVNLSGKILEGRAGPELDRRLKATLQKTVTFLDEEVTREMPVGVTGEARAGVSTKIDGLTGTVYEKGPAAMYVEVLEKGRTPGKKFPPPDAIRLWLERTDKGKLFVRSVKEKYFAQHAAKAKRNKTAKESLDKRILDTATFLKSRAIAKYGTPAIKMFEKVYLKRKQWVIDQFRKTVADFARSK
jgi:hypothetical protein